MVVMEQATLAAMIGWTTLRAGWRELVILGSDVEVTADYVEVLGDGFGTGVTALPLQFSMRIADEGNLVVFAGFWVIDEHDESLEDSPLVQVRGK